MVKFTPRIVGSGLVATIVLGGLVSAENCPVAALSTSMPLGNQTTAHDSWKRGSQSLAQSFQLPKEETPQQSQKELAAYTEAIRLNPKNADTYGYRGWLYRDLGDYQKALADYTKIIRLEPKTTPNYGANYANRGQVRSDLGDYQGALVDFAEAIRLSPDNPYVYAARAEFLVDRENFQDALQDANQSIQISDVFASGFIMRGAALTGLDDYRGAQQDFDRALKRLDGDNRRVTWQFYYWRGWLHLKQGRSQEAIADYEKAIKGWPAIAKSKAYKDYSLIARSQLNSPIASQSPPATTATKPQSTTTAVIDPPKPAVAPSPPNVYKIAKATTLLIEGQASGSGVIISKVGNTYFVLTAKHVVQSQQEYTVTTSSGKKYPLDYKQIKKLANLDLAVAQFTSNENLSIAQLGNSETVDQGDVIYVSGWPAEDQAITKRSQFASKGEIAGIQPGNADGYELMYGNSTGPGMSGGPIFNSNGQVVGIHGRAAGNEGIGKVGINLGIPVHLFLRQAPQAGLNLNQLGLRAEK